MWISRRRLDEIEEAAIRRGGARMLTKMLGGVDDRGCLRAAFAARHRFANPDNVFETESVLEAEGRAVRGFIDAVVGGMGGT